MILKNISVIIPAYNEEDRILETLNRLKFYCKKNFSNWEILIISDGSTDLTPRMVTNYMESVKTKGGEIKLLHYTQNKGKGYAVRQGLIKSKYKTKMILDADLSVSPKEFDANFQWFLKPTVLPTLVIGRRIQVESQPKYRLFLGKMFRTFVSLINGIDYHDSQCPFKILCNYPDGFFNKLKINGFSYDVELIRKSIKANFCIVEKQVEYYNTTDSKVTVKKMIRMFFDLIRIGRA